MPLSPFGKPASTGRGDTKNRSPKRYEFAVKVNFAEEVTTGVVNEFLVAIQSSRRLDPKTVNEYREILHRFFEWAIEQQGVRMTGEPRRNPVTAVKRLRSADPTIRFLQTMEDIHHQLEILTETKPSDCLRHRRSQRRPPQRHEDR